MPRGLWPSATSGGLLLIEPEAATAARQRWLGQDLGRPR